MKVRHLLVAIIIAVVFCGVVTFLYAKRERETSTKTSAPRFLFEITGGSLGHSLRNPVYAIAGPNGKIYISDAGNKTVKVFSEKKRFLYELGGAKSGKQLVYPYGIGIIGDNRVVVADVGAGAVYEYNDQGKYTRTWLDTNSKAGPAAVFVGTDKRVYVSDLQGNQILVFSGQGKLLRKIKSQKVSLKSPQGLAVNGDGTIWVADGGNYNVKLVNQNGDLKQIFDGGPSAPLTMAKGLAVDNKHRIYVADTLSNVIRVFDENGNDIFKFGFNDEEESSFQFPVGLSVDSENRIYVADQGNDKVQVWGWK